jgi:hypothetical protein
VSVAVLAMMCSIGAVFLPAVIVIPDNGASWTDGDTQQHHSSLLVHLALPHRPSTPKERRSFKQQQLSGLPDNSFQCPFLNGVCYFGDQELSVEGIQFKTDDFLAVAGCDSLGVIGDASGARFWTVAAACMSVATFLVAVGHASKGNNFGQNAALIKFGAAGIAASHVATCVVAMSREEPIGTCLKDNIVDTGFWKIVLSDYELVMLSMLVVACAGVLMFFGAIGMMLSWCCACCGSPPAREVYMITNVAMIQGPESMNVQPLYPEVVIAGSLPPPHYNQQMSYNPYVAAGYPPPQQYGYVSPVVK